MEGNNSTSKFIWKIEKFSKLAAEELFSEIFTAGGCKWRLSVFPKGNNTNFLSIYLEVPDSTSLPNGWNRDAKFSLAVVNQSNNNYTIKKETQQVFNSNDWYSGFRSFIALSKINDPSEKYLVNDTLIVEAEVVVRSAVQYSTPDPKTPSLAVIDEEKILPKEPPSQPIQPSQNVQIISKTLLTEISSRTRTDETSNQATNPDILLQNEALEGFFNMSLEAIQQANALGNIEGIVLKLIQNTNNLHKKTILEYLTSCLKEFQDIIPSARAIVETTPARRTSLTEKTIDLDSRLARRQNQLSSLEAEFSRVSKEEKKIQAEIQMLITQKQELSTHKNSVASQLEKVNDEASKDLEDWKSLEREIKQADEEWLGAKEKLTLANVRWKLFKKDLGLGKVNVS